MNATSGERVSSGNRVYEALQEFCSSLTEKLQAPTVGEAEAQLHGPILSLLEAIEQVSSEQLTVKAESRAEGRLGIPDFGVARDKLLVGYIELKAPGTGANTKHFSGRNREQWNRFRNLPNILYTDGTEWALYQDGELAQPLVRLSGDAGADGAEAASTENAAELKSLFAKFLAWEVIPPSSPKQLAKLLAPVCRMLRDEVSDALEDKRSPLVRLASEWREHLFPEASDRRFADAYAQTITYGLLLAKAEGADTLDLHEASEALSGGHTMLARALEVMTDPQAEKEIRPALRLVQRMIAGVKPETLVTSKRRDPWLYFYEDFLEAYDPQLRKDAGAYYTPVEVVRAQVRLVDDLLTTQLGMSMGLAEGDGVTILDPAAGTGTYLLGVIDHAMARVYDEEGPGAVKARASLLWQNIHGFEYMVSPYAVAELRLAQSMAKYQGKPPRGDPPVYLTNTLESPHTQPPAPPLFYEPIAKEHHRALQVKDRIPVMICLGNPPYDRHEAGTAENRARTGAWIRWGDDGQATDAPLNDYIEPARNSGHGGHLKNLYNLYVYFWRWAFWKVFEHEHTARGPGIVSYISASSYLEGDAFVGMREHMRRTSDEIWVLDLGGEGRGTRRTENVFAIQTPVAIAIAVRYTSKSHRDQPATVHYARLEGSREDKLKTLDRINHFRDLTWEKCPDTWQAPFRPAGTGVFFDWPRLTDLMPWQQSGIKVGRTWPIAPEPKVLSERWRAICQTSARERAALFVERPTGRKIHDSAQVLPPSSGNHAPLGKISSDEPVPHAYRSFDRQYIIADGRLIDRPGPPLWQAHSDRQMYLTTLLNHPLGGGPALTVAAALPDLHHFRGSYGAKEVIPFYRDKEGTQPNLLPGLLDVLSKTYGRDLTEEDWLGYLYGILAHPAYTQRFATELATREVRVPITTDFELFQAVRDIGKKEIWLHTYGERFVPPGARPGKIQQGSARCTVGIPDNEEDYPESFSYDPADRTLYVGEGEFRPVDPEIWCFDVSGLKVLQSWLAYRMKDGHGKTSSSLDEIRPKRWPAEFTTELLHLIWALEHTLADYPEQESLLERVISGPLMPETALPPAPESARKSPNRKRGADLFD
ncbi:N-6 DNA methylase [Ectothiorhodospiraceae bacterium WFHF3C12]|nr:N-6 DNA methylase [Ectothiorhodospiraceae bacterium WFHF3C12]